MKRPKTVTAAAGFVIALALMSIGGLLAELALTFKTSLPRQWLFVLLGSFVSVMSGIFILKGKNWARWGFLAWSLFTFAYALTEVKFIALTPHLILMTIIMLFLFGKSANRYFAQNEDGPESAI